MHVSAAYRPPLHVSSVCTSKACGRVDLQSILKDKTSTRLHVAVARADSPLAAFSQPSLQVPGAGLAQGNPTDNVKLFWHHIICDYVFM